VPLNIGPTEILIILLIALLLLGPSKIPQLARALGEAVKEFRKASSELTEPEKSYVKSLQQAPSAQSQAADEQLLRAVAEKLGVKVEGKSAEQLKAEVLEEAKKRGLV